MIQACYFPSECVTALFFVTMSSADIIVDKNMLSATLIKSVSSLLLSLLLLLLLLDCYYYY